MRIFFNVIAPVGRHNDFYRPIKIQKSYRPTVFFNVIAAKENVRWQKVRPLYLQDGGKSSPDRSQRITFNPKVPLYE